nr:sulfotransferase 6B1-like [Pogona vitticeps]
MFPAPPADGSRPATAFPTPAKIRSDDGVVQKTSSVQCQNDWEIRIWLKSCSLLAVLYPTTVSSAETFQALEKFESRKDDLVLVSYPKCGINWLIHIVKDLIATTLKTKQENEELPFIECGDPEKYQVLVLFRNPKDTAASFFHFHNSTPSVPSYNSWEEFFSRFMNGQVALGTPILTMQSLGTNIWMMKMFRS